MRRSHVFMLLVLPFRIAFDMVDCSFLLHHLYYTFCPFEEDNLPALSATLYIHVWQESVCSVCAGLCFNKVMVSLTIFFILTSSCLFFVKVSNVLRAWIIPEICAPIIQANDVMYCSPLASCLVAYLSVHWQQTWQFWLLSFSGMTCAMSFLAIWIYLVLCWLGQVVLGKGYDARVAPLRRLSLSGPPPLFSQPSVQEFSTD